MEQASNIPDLLSACLDVSSEAITHVPSDSTAVLHIVASPYGSLSCDSCQLYIMGTPARSASVPCSIVSSSTHDSYFCRRYSSTNCGMSTMASRYQEKACSNSPNSNSCISTWLVGRHMMSHRLMHAALHMVGGQAHGVAPADACRFDTWLVGRHMVSHQLMRAALTHAHGVAPADACRFDTWLVGRHMVSHQLMRAAH
eukprot:363419-Chlamydomonas_euryale.AAC.17